MIQTILILTARHVPLAMNKRFFYVKKILISFFTVILAITTQSVIAKEPVNLATVKKQYIEYHDSGAYEKDITKVIDDATTYLKARIAKADFDGKKPVIVLDIDETSLSNYPNIQRLSFGGTLDQFRENEIRGQDPVIAPTLKLYQFAKAQQIPIVFISGRVEEEQTATIANLEKAGYSGWAKLIFRSGQYRHMPAAEYKTAMRKQLTEQGYKVILNIGDQQSDLDGGYSDKNYKLPNPYYFIP